MLKSNRDTVQAVELIEGQMNVGAGTYVSAVLIHAETDAVISFPDFGTAETYTMLAGADRAFTGNFTVDSGTVTYN